MPRAHPGPPGDQSEREPPDPIPNSAVKPLSADDSAAPLWCESRSSPGSLLQTPVTSQGGGGFLVSGRGQAARRANAKSSCVPKESVARSSSGMYRAVRHTFKTRLARINGRTVAICTALDRICRGRACGVLKWRQYKRRCQVGIYWLYWAVDLGKLKWDKRKRPQLLKKLRPFLSWRPQGESNPCRRRERAVS